MAKDIRVIIVKLADRLHNMRTWTPCARIAPARIAQKPSTSTPGGQPHRPEQGLPRTARPVLQAPAPQPLPSAAQGHPRRGNRRELVSKIMQALSQNWCRPISRPRSGAAKKPVQHLSQDAGKQLSFSALTSTAFASSSTTFPSCYLALAPCTPCTSPFPVFGITSPFPRAMATKVCTPRCLALWHADRGRFARWTCRHIAEAGVANTGCTERRRIHRQGPAAHHQWLQEILELQAGSGRHRVSRTRQVDLFPDEVYVFHPRAASWCCRKFHPVDFAYAVHADIGPLHCRQDPITGWHPCARR